jgi:hypothetical protein
MLTEQKAGIPGVQQALENLLILMDGELQIIASSRETRRTAMCSLCATPCSFSLTGVDSVKAVVSGFGVTD